MKLYACLLVFILTSCVGNSINIIPSVPSIPPSNPNALVLLNDQPFLQYVEITQLKDIYQLSESHKKEFFSFFNAPEQATYFPNKRVLNFLKGKLNNFGFGEATMTASQGIESAQGNCLSLAILTESLSRIAGVDTAFKLVATPPVFRKEGELVLSSQHIKTVLYDPKKEYQGGIFVLFRGKLTVDYFPIKDSRTLRNVDKKEFDAMFYRNKAVELMIKGKNKLAYWYAKKALTINKNDGTAINILAVLYEGVNDNALAEALFVHGIKYSDEKFELLRNYHHLLKVQKRVGSAKLIEKQLSEYDQPDPFKWVMLGEKKYKEGEYLLAMIYFKKAIKIADYLHEPYFGIAKVYYSQGNFKLAQKAMKKAKNKARKISDITTYQMKYELLAKMLPASTIENKKGNML